MLTTTANAMMVRHTTPLLALFSLALLQPGLCAADEKPCTAHADGKFFDLSPLKASKDYEIKTPNDEVISFNVCQNVKTDLFGIKDDSINTGDVQGFIRRGHGDFIIGKVNTTVTVFDGKPRFVMSGGSRCKPKSGSEATDIRASAMIQFHCDISSPGFGTPRLMAQLPPGDAEGACAYLIEWKTHFACPASEGGFLWSFFAITSVVFLVLLMAYTVLGTLYNRFVLQLRGFDQIPQFSIESMKYHAREAVDWIKDMVAGLDVGGRGNNQGGSYSRAPADLRTPNPFSHQSQVSGFGGPEDIEEGASLAGGLKGTTGNTGGFIRPGSASNRAAAFSRMPTTNPVSHQTQVIADQNVNSQSLSFSDTALSPRSPLAAQQLRSPPANAKRMGSDIPSAPEERDFMLGNDDDDAEELGDVTSFIRPTATSLAQHSQSNPASPQEAPPLPSTVATSPSPPVPEPNPAAAARGRDLGNGDVIRL